MLAGFWGVGSSRDGQRNPKTVALPEDTAISVASAAKDFANIF
jgi:hypothetical protein